MCDNNKIISINLTKQAKINNVLQDLETIADNLYDLTPDDLMTNKGCDVLLKELESYTDLSKKLKENKTFSLLDPNEEFELDFSLNLVEYNLNNAIRCICSNVPGNVDSNNQNIYKLQQYIV